MSESFQIRTDQVRDGFLAAYDTYRDLAAGWFDAWLDRERAVARREGQAEAWEEGRKAGRIEADTRPYHLALNVNPYRQEAGQ